jgi:hypothetical protein
VIINLIAHAKTRGGLKIRAGLDAGHDETGKKASDEKLRERKFVSLCFMWIK